VLVLAWNGDRWQIDAVIEAPAQAQTVAPSVPATMTTMLSSANLPEATAKGR